MRAERPVLVDSDIQWLVAVAKPVSDIHWRDRLLSPKAGRTVGEGQLDLAPLPDGAPLGGALHIYSRQTINPEAASTDWSTGLVYTDYADNKYTVIRCNGAHETCHRNRIEGDYFERVPHVHYLTERYQRHPLARDDGFAQPTDAFATLAEAVEHLISLVNLVPEGTLFL
jgi:hypothetical protein